MLYASFFSFIHTRLRLCRVCDDMLILSMYACLFAYYASAVIFTLKKFPLDDPFSSMFATVSVVQLQLGFHLCK